jgi:hypothetical protein
VFAVAWAGVILLLTLARVEPTPGQSRIETLCLICGDRGLADAILNIGLFVPLGFGVGAVAGWRAAVGSAVILSAGVELTQVFTPGRFPTVGDVVFNTLGGAAGWGLTRVIDALPRWLRAPTLRGRALGRLGSAGLILTPLALLAPHAPASNWWMQWTPDLGHMEAYAGRVIDARADSILLPEGPIGGDARMRNALLSDTDLDVTFVAGPPPSRVAPVASVYSRDRLQVLMIAIEDDDVLYYRRTLGNALALDQPGVRWPGAMSGMPGDTVRVRVRRERGRVCLSIDSTEDCGRSLGARDGWRLLLAGPTARLDPALVSVLGLAWLAFAGAPVGLVATSARSAAAWGLTLGLAAGLLAEALPETTFQVAGVMAVTAGALAGWALGQLVATSRVAVVEPDPPSRSAAA